MLRIVWMYECKSKHCRCSHLAAVLGMALGIVLGIVLNFAYTRAMPGTSCSSLDSKQASWHGSKLTHFQCVHIFALYLPLRSSSWLLIRLRLVLQQISFSTGGSTQRSVSWRQVTYTSVT